MKKQVELDENLARCLRVRRKLERQYPTFEAFSAFVKSLEDKPELSDIREGKRQTTNNRVKRARNTRTRVAATKLK
jgi:hypothetical protein